MVYKKNSGLGNKAAALIKDPLSTFVKAPKKIGYYRLGLLCTCLKCVVIQLPTCFVTDLSWSTKIMRILGELTILLGCRILT